MKALIVRSDDPGEMEFITDLLKKLGVSAMEISDEELEDFGMSILMKDVERSKKVSREVVMKKLQSE